MDSIPPTREELERLPLPDLLSRAQQLGADISYVHDRAEIIDVLAGQRRQLLTRYAEELQKFKIRLEGQNQELELARGQYQTTYDRVEQAVTDRFAQLHDQLLRKEVEVRGHLAYLKNSGDDVINDCLSAMNRELSILEDTLIRCQSRDLDVLDITPAAAAITVNVPSVTGRCFEFSDITALDLGGLRITLDLNATSRAMQMEPPHMRKPAASSAYQPPPQIQQQPQHPQPQTLPQQTMQQPQHQQQQQPFPHSYPSSGGASYPAQHPYSQPSVGRYGGGSGGMPSMPSGRDGVDILSFPLDSEIEVKQDAAGMSLRMMPNVEGEVIGTKAHESFSDGVHVWKVRLDNIQESLLGMVDSKDHSGAGTEGFFWSPVRRDVHGKRGKPASTISSIPVTQQGDVIKLTYDADSGTVRVAHNNVDRGLLCTELYGHMSPCFIFGRGEGLTILQ